MLICVLLSIVIQLEVIFQVNCFITFMFFMSRVVNLNAKVEISNVTDTLSSHSSSSNRDKKVENTQGCYRKYEYVE